jgi:predicted hotdog family 3-hydroxylacyl-ACP dehydratase
MTDIRTKHLHTTARRVEMVCNAAKLTADEVMALGISVAAAAINTYARMNELEDDREAIALGFIAGLLKHLGLAIDIMEAGPDESDVVH